MSDDYVAITSYALRARIAELEAALRPLAEACAREFISEATNECADDEDVFCCHEDMPCITFGMIRRALATLSKPKEGL